MTHDPMCFIDFNPLMRECRICDLIAKIREQEQRKCVSKSENRSRWREEGVVAGYRTGYNTALRHAVKAVKSLTHGGGNPNAVYRLPGIISAIEALAERERNDWQNGSADADSLDSSRGNAAQIHTALSIKEESAYNEGSHVRCHVCLLLASTCPMLRDVKET